MGGLQKRHSSKHQTIVTDDKSRQLCRSGFVCSKVRPGSQHAAPGYPPPRGPVRDIMTCNIAGSPSRSIADLATPCSPPSDPTQLLKWLCPITLLQSSI